MEGKKRMFPAALDLCPFCGALANKTNAHLIPWFIIKHYITQEGSGTRDKELSFSISSGHFTKLYAGRSVLPEKLEEFGDLHDLEKEDENPYSRDHLWCNQCEEKFSRLEAIFSSRFPEKKMQQLLPNLLVHKDQHIVFDEGFDYSMYQIFIQSIFWRCSVGQFDGFILHPSIENKIRENLREAFKTPDFHKLKAGDQLQVLHPFPLITFLLFSETEEDPTKNFIMINKVRIPYFIMAGKWLFQLFEKEGHIRGTQEWLYGLRTSVDTATLYPKITGKSHIILLNEPVSSAFTKNRLADFTDKKIRGLQRDIRQCHLQIFGHKPDAFIQNYIQQQYFVHRESGKTEFESFVHAFHDLKKLS